MFFLIDNNFLNTFNHSNCTHSKQIFSVMCVINIILFYKGTIFCKLHTLYGAGHLELLHFTCIGRPRSK